MKPDETASTVGPDVHRRNHRRHRYQKVLDSRKQPIRGLWKRNDRFLARITVETPEGKKVVCWKPLEAANSVAEAQAALRKLLTEREQGKPIAIKRAPKFKETAQRYQEHHAKLGNAKRGATLAKEKASLDLWIEHMGELRTDKINKRMLNEFAEKRSEERVSPRTINLDMIALRNVMKLAIDDETIVSSPVFGWRPLKWEPKKPGCLAWLTLRRFAKQP